MLALLVALVDPTELATIACTQRMAQLAATYGIKSIASHVARDAEPVGNGWQILLDVTIQYGNENRRAVIACTVSGRGRVQSLEGLTRE